MNAHREMVCGIWQQIYSRQCIPNSEMSEAARAAIAAVMRERGLFDAARSVLEEFSKNVGTSVKYEHSLLHCSLFDAL
jgi:hypothetical protein